MPVIVPEGFVYNFSILKQDSLGDPIESVSANGTDKYVVTVTMADWKGLPVGNDSNIVIYFSDNRASISDVVSFDFGLTFEVTSTQAGALTITAREAAPSVYAVTEQLIFS